MKKLQYSVGSYIEKTTISTGELGHNKTTVKAVVLKCTNIV